ncbi:glycoside hydrolase family 25 protein [Leptospira kanakyensis]|uniref:Lysozyme n=1 Tax=Leptospira kanakyensis TaxID=2484968 RepID=A0A6N4QAQ2_9LEPT|nr:GH25 family lysozyme [Leptospira kanakyensis]MCW7480262.1 glycoside hydrolase family 25 protein [Leptospira kanakyensis]TGK50456.1 lysozyme [Leptospira kanakyensis]TGK63943.1 lysozyme [Leptospira kanakyensis]TGK69594.1 lysozyme [Leptospira kanakyensis]
MIKKIFILAFLVLFAVSALYKAFDLGLIWFVYPSEERYPIRGIDVSNHQGKIDWDLIPKKQISFVYIKATEGGDFKDKSFPYNWKEAKRVGFKVGAYHFFTLCKTGAEQAENFIQSVPLEIDSLPPVVDLEFVGNCKDRPKIENVQSEISIFLNKVDTYYKTKTILYLTNEFIEKYLGDQLFNHPIWIRNIFVHPNTFTSIDWMIWQYKSTARIDGISGPVDLNVLNGNLESLIQMNHSN